MGSRGARALRGTVAAALATFFAAFSHAVAGGALSLTALLLALILSTFVCIALTRAHFSRTHLVLAVVVSQSLYHSIFAAIPAAQATSLTQAHHGPVELAVVAGSHSAHSGLGMWLGHVAAAIVTSLVLVFGESVIFTLLRLVRFAADPRAFMVHVHLAGPVAVVRTPRRILAAGLSHLRGVIARRGPPLFA